MDGWELADTIYRLPGKIIPEQEGKLYKLPDMKPTVFRKCPQCGGEVLRHGVCDWCKKGARTPQKQAELETAKRFPLGTIARRRGIDMQELAVRAQTGIAEVSTEAFWTREKVALVKQQLMPGCSDGELGLFLQTCKVSGLNPFVVPRQVWAIKYGGQWNPVVAIDGLRSAKLAEEVITHQDGPYWCGPDGKWLEVWVARAYPLASKVTIHLVNGESISAVVYWESYRQQQGTNKSHWGTDAQPAYQAGAHMLGKCAEAAALKKCPGKVLPVGVEVSVDGPPAEEAADVDPDTGEIVEPAPTKEELAEISAARSQELDTRKECVDHIRAMAKDVGLDASAFRELLTSEFEKAQLSALTLMQVQAVEAILQAKLDAAGEAGGEG